MPGHPAVKDGEGLGHVEVEPFVRREGPEAKVEAVRDDRDGEGNGTTEDGFSEEGREGGLYDGGLAVESEAGEGQGDDAEPDEEVCWAKEDGDGC